MRTVYFWWSASEVHGATMLRWTRCRRSCGGKNTNKLGVGPVIKSWLFGGWRLQNARMSYRTGDKPPSRRSTANWFRNIRHHQPVGFGVLRPYVALYPTYEDARHYRNEIKRPTVEQVDRLIKRRKV